MANQHRNGLALTTKTPPARALLESWERIYAGAKDNDDAALDEAIKKHAVLLGHSRRSKTFARECEKIRTRVVENLYSATAADLLDFVRAGLRRVGL